jgi:sugar lactone lactonase YvrE
MGISHSRTRSGWIASCLLALAAGAPGALAADDQPLFQSHAITDSVFTKHIEGPAVDAEGNLYVVNFGGNGSIGKLASGAAQFKPFAKLDDPPNRGSIGNGIRFDKDGRMFIADFVNHNVFVIEHGESSAKVYFHSGLFHQPNDLAVAADGTLYVSDPDLPHGTTGRIWRITRNPDGTAHGEIMEKDLPAEMGTTNGIDLSPDGTTLYVSESNSLQLLSYRIDGNHLRDRHQVFQFHPREVDGVRTDVDGRIYVARPSMGQIAIINPNGTLVRTVPLKGRDPTNLTFGGPDGRTVFVTQADGKFVEAFRTDRPGREPCLQTHAPGMC